MWKKKYYQEKKKTPALEDQNKNLKIDLDQSHQKILQNIENESKHSVQTGHLKESEINVRINPSETSRLNLSLSRLEFHSANHSDPT